MADHKLNPFARNTKVALPEHLRDSFGRVLHEGDHLQLTLPKAPLFRVQKIVPVFDTKLPPNLMDITIQCTLKFRAARDEAIGEFTRILTAEEAPGPPREDIRDEPTEPEEPRPTPPEPIDEAGR